MKNQNNKKKWKNLFTNKRAQAAIATAVKVVTSLVLGGLILVGTYGVVNSVVIPTTQAKVSSIAEYSGDGSGGAGTGSGGVEFPSVDPDTVRAGTIPEGATYTVSATSETLSGDNGDSFPDSPATGDTYEEGDYTYKYNLYNEYDSWSQDSSQNGWGVRVKDTSKTSYGAILSEIAEEPVTNMSSTFYGCASLTTAPAIPNSVTDMSDTFYDCTSLKTYVGSADADGDFSDYQIPNSVTDMSGTFAGTFEGCTSLTTAPAIPNSVTSMSSTFRGCTSLTTAPVIPNSVTGMTNTFDGCTSLTTAPAIPNSVTNMNTTFSGCTSLTTAPVIPNSVTDMSFTFSGCTSLTTAPAIPNSVTSMWSTFKRCTSLKTYAGSADADGDFSDYQIPNSVTNMSFTFSRCTKLTTAPTIPNSVTDMSGTFDSCTSLTTAPVIPNSVTNMSNTFYGCTSLTTAPTIPNSVTDMSYTFDGCTSLAGTIEVNADPWPYSNCLKSTQITGITGSCSQARKNALLATK